MSLRENVSFRVCQKCVTQGMSTVYLFRVGNFIKMGIIDRQKSQGGTFLGILKNGGTWSRIIDEHNIELDHHDHSRSFRLLIGGARELSVYSIDVRPDS